MLALRRDRRFLSRALDTRRTHLSLVLATLRHILIEGEHSRSGLGKHLFPFKRFSTSFRYTQGLQFSERLANILLRESLRTRIVARAKSQWARMVAWAEFVRARVVARADASWAAFVLPTRGYLIAARELDHCASALFHADTRHESARIFGQVF